MHFFIKGLHKGGDSFISIDLFAWHVYELQNLLILTISSLLQRSMWLWQHYKKRTTFMEFKAGMLMILKWSAATKEIECGTWCRISCGKYFRGYDGISGFSVMDPIPAYEFRSVITGLRARITTCHLDIVIVWRTSKATACHQWTWETWINNRWSKLCTNRTLSRENITKLIWFIHYQFNAVI